MKLIKFIKYNFLNVFRYSLFNKNISIRRPQRIDRSVKILTSNGGKIEIGKGCHLLRNTTVQSDSGHISIGNGTFINENAKIVSHKKLLSENVVHSDLMLLFTTMTTIIKMQEGLMYPMKLLSVTTSGLERTR